MPQAPSTQRRERPVVEDHSDLSADLFDEATQHEMPAAPSLTPPPARPRRPSRVARPKPANPAPTRGTPNSLPEISPTGFRTPPVQPDEPDALGAETLMTPSGGAARRAWQDVAEAGAPPDARFGGSAAKGSSGLLDVQTDPELFSSDGIDATRPLPALDDEDRTHLGDEPLPASVRPRRAPDPRDLPSFPSAPPPPAETRPLAPGPHGTRKLPAHTAAGQPRPDTRTHSLASLGEGDEPPNEPTRLGELAGPDPFIRPPERPTSQAAWAEPLKPAPVFHEHPPAPVAPAETIAAPGELAGLIDDLEARAHPRVSDGPPPPPDAVPAQTLGGSPSMVRQGLASRLPASDTPLLELPEPAGPPPEAEPLDPEDFGVVPLEETNDVLEPLDSGPPLEATRALIEPYDDGQLSMPGDPLGPVIPTPIDGRSDTGPMRPLEPTHGLDAAAPPREETAAELVAAVEWTVATRMRRLGATLLDGLVLLGLLAVPALLGLFGEPVAQASPIEPDDVSQLLWQGYLTLPLVAGGVLGFAYVTLTTAAAGRSLGKLAFGLQVIRNSDGRSPGFGQAVLRGLFALLGALLGGLGVFWPIVDGASRALHDKLSGTTVVRAGSERSVDATAG